MSAHFLNIFKPPNPNRFLCPYSYKTFPPKCTLSPRSSTSILRRFCLILFVSPEVHRNHSHFKQACFDIFSLVSNLSSPLNVSIIIFTDPSGRVPISSTITERLGWVIGCYFLDVIKRPRPRIVLALGGRWEWLTKLTFGACKRHPFSLLVPENCLSSPSLPDD